MNPPAASESDPGRLPVSPDPDAPGVRDSVRAARDRYLAANGLDTASYAAPRFVLALGKLRVTLPNPGLLPYHDLHHVLTGFGSDPIGEAEISVFELRGGGANGMVTGLCVAGILYGLVLAPRRVVRAWHRCASTRSLYGGAIPYDALLAMTVGELRTALGIPPDGLAEQMRDV